MILKEISDLIVVDQLISKNNAKYTFFLSYFNEDFVLNSNFDSRIHTSSFIGNVMRTKERENIPLKLIKTLQNKVTHTLQLSNGDILNVTMFKDEEPSGNVLFHFELDSRTAIYLGKFKQITKVMWNKTFIDLVSKGVSYLYIDNTNSESIYHSTEEEVSHKLKNLLKNHTKVIINTPVFGYQDLIKTFVLDFNFKVYIHNDITKCLFYKTECIDRFEKSQKDCEIAMIPDSQNLEFIKSRLNLKKIATVRLFDFQKEFENQNYEKIGLFQFCYSSHISRMEIFTFIKLIQPEYIKEIYNEYPVIPNFIKSASKRWKYETSQSSIENNLDQIENYALETRVENPEYLESFIENALSDPLPDKSTNDSNNSTDCVEVHLDPEELTDKIKNAVYKIPKRRKIKEKPINLERNIDTIKSFKKVENTNTNEVKTDTSNILINKESTETLKNDEFASLLNTNFTNFGIDDTFIESEASEFVTIKDTTTTITKENSECAKQEGEKSSLENKHKETNENYISFLDNNSASSKASNNSEYEKLQVNSKHFESKRVLEKKDVQISCSLLENVVESVINKSFNKEEGTSRGNKNNTSQSFDKKCSSKMFLKEKDNEQPNENKESPRYFKENNKPKSVAISFSLTEKVLGQYKEFYEVPKNKKKSPDKLIGSAENSKNLTNFNPLRRSLFISKKKIKEDNTAKYQEKKVYIKNKGVDEKQPIAILHSSPIKKRRKTSESVEAIEDTNIEVIEIVDNSPPLRRTRSSGKADIVEIKSKRKVKKQGAVAKLYEDDNDL